MAHPKFRIPGPENRVTMSFKSQGWTRTGETTQGKSLKDSLRPEPLPHPPNPRPSPSPSHLHPPFTAQLPPWGARKGPTTPGSKGSNQARVICDTSTVSQRDFLPADFVVRNPFDSHHCKACFTGTRERPNFLAINSQASLVAQMVKNLPTVQETQLPSLDWKGMATHSSYSGLENSTDRGARRAAVTKSQMQLSD